MSNDVDVTLVGFYATNGDTGDAGPSIGINISVSAGYPTSFAVDVDIIGFGVDVVGLVGGSLNVNANLISFSVDATSAPISDIDLDSFNISGFVATGLIANASALMSGFSVSGSGSGENPTSTLISLAFGVSGTLLSQNNGAASIDLNSFSAQAVGLTGNVGNASATVVLTVGASGYGAITYVGDIGPIKFGVDAVVYEILPDTGFKVTTMNPDIGGDSTTEFLNYDFNSFVLFNGVYYGAAVDGLYDLSGSTDSGQPIAARMLMGVTDFNSETQLYVPYLYLTYRTDGDLQIITRTNESVERMNDAQWGGETGIHEKRVRLNPGVKNRQWQFGFQNVDGADFEVSEIRPLPMPTERRIR